MMTVEQFAERLIELLQAKRKSCGGDLLLQAGSLEVLLRAALAPEIVTDSRYPKCLYHEVEPPRLVANADEEQALGEGWTAQPQVVV